MTDTLVPADLQEDIYRLALLSEFVKLAAQARNDLRAETFPRLPNGTKLTARHPRTGESLGTVSMSDPDPTAYIVDDAQFDAWVREQNPGDLETVRGFGDPAEVAAVLAEQYRGARHDQLVDSCLSRWTSIQVAGTDRSLARRVGNLLGRHGLGSEHHVDATVVATALAAGGGLILTSDPRDLERLADGLVGVQVKAI